MAAAMIFSRCVGLTGFLGCTVFLLCLSAWPAAAQVLPTGKATETGNSEPWHPPEITNLPLSWWSGFDTSSPDEFQQRMAQFAAATQQKFQGLEGEDLDQAQSLLARIQEQAGLLALALRGQ
jgi:hypothetical protein